uniref:Uncharacterized protein n=1 Tax=Ciona savignyi TaxID=51511 RepID=H2YWG2_CIOSA
MLRINALLFVIVACWLFISVNGIKEKVKFPEKIDDAPQLSRQARRRNGNQGGGWGNWRQKKRDVVEDEDDDFSDLLD